MSPSCRSLLRTEGAQPRASAGTVFGLCLLAVVLTACTSKPIRTVAVEDRSPSAAAMGAPRTPQTRPSVTTEAVSSGTVSAGTAQGSRPGTYTVKPGDTLIRIALDHGQNWRDIVRWNQLDNPNVIEVGQVLRVRPETPTQLADARPRPEPKTESKVEMRPLRPETRSDARTDPRTDARSEVRPNSTSPTTGAVASGAVGAASAASSVPGSNSMVQIERSPAKETVREPATREPAGDVPWAWPASGPLLQGFDEQKNKGLNIGGSAGDPVMAAADGRVVYAGAALRGYGNLVIIKHNATYLTAYAHNQTLLVKEDQAVKRGQKIAEMGNSDSERVQLHFEIRREGKPIDPARLLPNR